MAAVHLNIDPTRPDSRVVQVAAQFLVQGEVILHPTETVYGLAARWDVEEALRKTARLKQRSERQPYSIMVDRIEEIFELTGLTDQRLARLLALLLPGPVTILLPRRKALPVPYWNQFPELGFRLPDHTLSRALVRTTTHPLITTSANLSGQAPPARLEEVPTRIQQGVACILDGGPCPLKIPSTIIRIPLPEWRYELVRAGAMAEEEIKRFFQQV